MFSGNWLQNYFDSGSVVVLSQMIVGSVYTSNSKRWIWICAIFQNNRWQGNSWFTALSNFSFEVNWIKNGRRWKITCQFILDYCTKSNSTGMGVHLNIKILCVWFWNTFIQTAQSQVINNIPVLCLHDMFLIYNFKRWYVKIKLWLLLHDATQNVINLVTEHYNMWIECNPVYVRERIVTVFTAY